MGKRKLKNITIAGANDKPILFDVLWNDAEMPQPMVLFIHGFKGFKDWGTWEIIGQKIADAGCVFVKMNFSHNGTTPENPCDFGDLEAFGNNNYSKELQDVTAVIDWFQTQTLVQQEAIMKDNITLIGHSRGGGIALIKAAEEAKVRQVVTWASVETLAYSFDADRLDAWRKSGVVYVANARTKQEMPLYFQLYEDFDRNRARLDVEAKLRNFEKPHLIIHGTNDPAVPKTAAEQHKAWNPAAELHLIEGADHVFGGKHPFEGDDLPPHTEELTKSTIAFLKSTLFVEKNRQLRRIF